MRARAKGESEGRERRARAEGESGGRERRSKWGKWGEWNEWNEWREGASRASGASGAKEASGASGASRAKEQRSEWSSGASGAEERRSEREGSERTCLGPPKHWVFEQGASPMNANITQHRRDVRGRQYSAPRSGWTQGHGCAVWGVGFGVWGMELGGCIRYGAYAGTRTPNRRLRRRRSRSQRKPSLAPRWRPFCADAPSCRCGRSSRGSPCCWRRVSRTRPVVRGGGAGPWRRKRRRRWRPAAAHYTRRDPRRARLRLRLCCRRRGETPCRPGNIRNLRRQTPPPAVRERGGNGQITD